MIKWVNFLHIYQPPYQEPEVVQKISRESYWPLVKTLAENSNAKITLNFSRSTPCTNCIVAARTGFSPKKVFTN